MTKTITESEFLSAVTKVAEDIGKIAAEALCDEDDDIEMVTFIEAQKFALGCSLLWRRLTDGE